MFMRVKYTFQTFQGAENSTPEATTLLVKGFGGKLMEVRVLCPKRHILQPIPKKGRKVPVGTLKCCLGDQNSHSRPVAEFISSHFSLIHCVMKLSLRGHGAKCKTIKLKISSELFSAWAFLGKLSIVFYLPLLLALLVGNRSHISKVSMPDWRLLFRVAQIHGFML